jgi:hypothetical protein
MRPISRFIALCVVLALLCLGEVRSLRAELPNPVLQAVSPSGLQAGTETTVTIEGTGLDGLRDLRSTAPGFSATKGEKNQFNVSVPANTPPGIYDLRAVTDHGQTAPRAFVVSRLKESSETSANDTPETATPVELNSAVSGKIEKASDVDCFRFSAKQGDRVVIECWAERIDSQLRAVIEVSSEQGQRLAVSRGHTGLDPLVDFRVPVDGSYLVRLYDLSYLGSANHFYRLDFDTRARPEFALPCVVTRGAKTRVTLWGRNLARGNAPSTEYDSLPVDIAAPNEPATFIPLPQRPAQVANDMFAYHHPSAHAPVAIGLTDLPVIENTAGHDRSDRALALTVPCEVSAQIATGYGQHWYSLDVKRGEVLWFETLGDRIGSPVDLELTVLDATGKRELANFTDELDNLGGYRFATTHTDPVGRWVAPADGRYLVLMRNLIGGSEVDPRRIYRLSVRREEPDFQLAVVARRTDQPAAWNVSRGGRESVEVIALRRRGMSGAIRVSAEGLPPGLDCPDVWIGPGQDRAPLVITASRESALFAGNVSIVGHHDEAGVLLKHQARSGSMIWPGRPMPSGRVTQEIPLATGLDAPFTLTATPKVTSLDQASMLEVDVALEARGDRPTTPVRLSAIGLPRGVDSTLVTMPPESGRAWMSFFLPESLPPGKYTFAIQADFEAMVALTPQAKPAKTLLTLVSNPITIEVKPARIILGVDRTSPTKIARGKITQLKFNAERVNGFLGKVHVELVAPGGVVGLRARGVTLTGQGDSGSLQVIATDNAPLGRHAQLRLDAVGTVEDQPIYRASRVVELEIIE